MYSCKIYSIKPEKLDNIVSRLLEKRSGVVYEKNKDVGNLKFNSVKKNDKPNSKNETYYECYIDKVGSYWRYGESETVYVYSHKAQIVIKTTPNTNQIWLFALMDRKMQTVFEKIIDEQIKDDETLCKISLNLNEVKQEFTEYVRFTMNDILHNNLKSLSAKGTDVYKAGVYKEAKELKGKVVKILVKHNGIYSAQIFIDGVFNLMVKDLAIDKQIKIIFEIFEILQKNNLVKIEGWNRNLNDFFDTK